VCRLGQRALPDKPALAPGGSTASCSPVSPKPEQSQSQAATGQKIHPTQFPRSSLEEISEPAPALLRMSEKLAYGYATRVLRGESLLVPMLRVGTPATDALRPESPPSGGTPIPTQSVGTSDVGATAGLPAVCRLGKRALQTVAQYGTCRQDSLVRHQKVYIGLEVAVKLQCPHCGTLARLTADVPPPETVRCPHCKERFDPLINLHVAGHDSPSRARMENVDGENIVPNESTVTALVPTLQALNETMVQFKTELKEITSLLRKIDRNTSDLRLSESLLGISDHLMNIELSAGEIAMRAHAIECNTSH